MPSALFVPDRGRLVPTELARGPWSADALHGGPVAAILARAIEACDTLAPMRVTRLTVELVRQVPLAPLTVSARIVRQQNSAVRDPHLHQPRLDGGGGQAAGRRLGRARLREPAEPGRVGQAESLLFDQQGAFGRALQSLYVDVR